MIGPSIFNPWVLLAIALLAGASFFGGDIQGAKRGANEVQVRWDKREAEISAANEEVRRLVQKSTDNLQGAMDAARKDNARAMALLNDDLERMRSELQQRPTRPSGSGGNNQAPRAGPDGGTGLGLYREDALFLVGEAATGKLIKLQRDQCYAAYERAQNEIARLQTQEKAP